MTVQKGPAIIQVWVCPNCGDHYSSSGSSNLDELHNHRTNMQNSANEDPSEWGKSIGPRSKCQMCKSSKGLDVNRVKREYIRMDAAPTIDTIRRVIERMEIEETKVSGSRKQVPYNPTRQAEDSS